MSERNTIVVDGSNVAYLEKSRKGQPRLSNIIGVRAAIVAAGFTPIIIVDASLIHRIDDPDQLDRLIEEQAIRQAPAGTDADHFILEIADRMNAWIVSNDRYERHESKRSWIDERRIPLMIIGDEVQFYEDQLRKHVG